MTISQNRVARSGFIGLATVLLAIAILAPASHGQFRALETRDLRLITYSLSHDFLVEHMARCYENAMRFHRLAFDYVPSEKITVLLQDFGDYASGGANTVPFNLVGVGIAPFSYAYETMPPIERMTMMMNHELAHVAMMDKPSPSDRFFRALFGGKPAPTAAAPESMLWAHLTSPRWNSPRWFIEGSAVFMETWMNGGLGRALGAYDEMVFRTMARDSAYFYDVVGLEAEGTKVDFQVGAASYLYGTRFISYIGLRHGPGKLLEWFAQSDSSSGGYASQFENALGVSLDDAWDEWIAWERGWQKTNLDSIRQYPITPMRRISPAALGSVSRAFVDRAHRTLYAAVNAPGQTAHLVGIDLASGEIRELQHVRGGAIFYVSSLAYDDSANVIYYTTDNNQWRDLHAFDIATGTSRRLLQDARIGDLAFNPMDKSLWGIRHFNGISTIVRIPSPYDRWTSQRAWDYGKDVFDIDVSPDGSALVAALAEVTGRQSLIRLSIPSMLAGADTAEYETLFDFDISTPATFAYARDGRHIYGSTYYSGVSNIVRYDVGRRDMEWLTNAESGLFRPVPLGGDSLVAFHFTAKGFVPVILPERPVENVNAIRYLGQEVVTRYPDLRQWALPPPSPANIPLDPLIVSSGEYTPISGFRLASLYPVVQGYKEFAAFGLRANFADPLSVHRLDLTASYTPNRLLPVKERLHAKGTYSFSRWGLSASYNAADFYDLVGPFKSSRKGISARVSYSDYLLFDEPEMMNFAISAAAYWRLDRLPEYQNIAPRYDRFYSISFALSYSYLERSLGAIEEERGMEWSLAFPANFIVGHVFPRAIASGSAGMLLPMDHSSLWFRAAAGKAFGPRFESLANFYFGGFGNNWVDYGRIWRYRDPESFPGADINGVGGTNFGKAGLEWTLPPLRFRRFGTALLYCTWARPSLFTSVLSTNIDRADLRRTLLNAGVQADFRLVFFSSFEATLSCGYAYAFERDRTPSTEYLISLKIL